MRRSAVFLAFLAFYLATMSGTIASSDGHTMLQLTRSIAERGRFDIPSGNGFPGVAGRFYPKAGLGQALAAVPFYQVARVSAALVPALQRKREAWIRYVVQLLNPLVMALLMWIFLLFLEETGVHSRDALVCAALLGVSTPLWPYAKSFLTEPLTALLLLAGFRAAWHFGQRGRSVQAVACGACIGALVLVKMASLLSALGLGAYLAWQAWQRREVFRALLASALPVLAFAVLILHYNFARFGNLTESGYMSEQTAAAYGTPLLVGLYGLLFSSGKGLLWFAPLLVLLPWAVGRCWSRARAELVASASSWGPR